MRREFSFMLAVAMILGMAVSCTEPTEDSSTSDEVNIIIIQETLNVPASGGEFSVDYSVIGGGTVSPEAVSQDSWIGGWDYSTAGSIGFTVEENTTSSERQTVVTVVCAGMETPVTFTVIQADPSRVTAEELHNTRWTARICQFDRDSTLFQEVNPESHGEIFSSYITAGEFADQYAADWNRANPNDMITPEDAICFQYTDTTTAGETGTATYFNITFNEGYFESEYGQQTPVGGVNVICNSGYYTYDEATGLLTIQDVSSTLYTREVVGKITRENGELVYRVIKTWWPDYLSVYFGSSDMFGFNISNYDGSECYKPHGKLVYYLYEVDFVTEE